MNAFQWIGRNEIDAFWATLWKSPQGHAWAHGDSAMSVWLHERLRSRPFYKVTPWEPELQRRHFSQMWGQVFERHYDNSALHDLYWVHELAHWALVDFTPSSDWEAWSRKWDHNELLASFISEVLVHGESPDWDSAALHAPAWARQFSSISATDPLDSTTWSAGALSAWERRVSVRAGKTSPTDETERWLASFLPENARWASTWQSSWAAIDAGLNDYWFAQQSNDEPAMRRALDAAGSVAQWPCIPYHAEAVAFANKPST